MIPWPITMSVYGRVEWLSWCELLATLNPPTFETQKHHVPHLPLSADINISLGTTSIAAAAWIVSLLSLLVAVPMSSFLQQLSLLPMSVRRGKEYYLASVNPNGSLNVAAEIWWIQLLRNGQWSPNNVQTLKRSGFPSWCFPHNVNINVELPFA